jgi:hypothetical protein
MRGSIAEELAIAVYAIGFFAMFGFSFAYSLTPPSPLKWLLRRMDHSSRHRLLSLARPEVPKRSLASVCRCGGGLPLCSHRRLRCARKCMIVDRRGVKREIGAKTSKSIKLDIATILAGRHRATYGNTL